MQPIKNDELEEILKLIRDKEKQKKINYEYNRTKFEKTILFKIIKILTFILKYIGFGKSRKLANLGELEYRLGNLSRVHKYHKFLNYTDLAKLTKLKYPYINKNGKIICYGLSFVSISYVVFEVDIFGNVIQDYSDEKYYFKFLD